MCSYLFDLTVTDLRPLSFECGSPHNQRDLVCNDTFVPSPLQFLGVEPEVPLVTWAPHPTLALDSRSRAHRVALFLFLFVYSILRRRTAPEN